MRGHDETEGNLSQLLIMLSNDCPDVKSYIHEKNYMSHEIVDEQMSLMANRLLRSLLTAISENNPTWYAIKQQMLLKRSNLIFLLGG